MLRIETFNARAGGNVLYKALAHPLAAEAIGRLYARLGAAGPVALYDPDGIAEVLLALYPGMPGLAGLFVHDVTLVGQNRAGFTARKLTELPESGARTVLIAAFDAARIAARIAPLLPAGAAVLTFDEAKLPADMLTVRGRYLDRLNFATNFAFFRDAGGLSTRLVSANYWAGYGVAAVRRHRPGTCELGAGSSRRTRWLLDRQPCGSRAFRAWGFHRAVVHPRDRRRRPRRGEIRA
jgi:hypothetical protein